MILFISADFILIILLALALFAIVFILLILKYKTKIYSRKIENLEKQIQKYAGENKDFKTKLDELVYEKTKDFHQQMEINKKLNTERKIALKKANDANFLKNAFLSNMSHEIRTPLNSIMGFSSLLQSEFSERGYNEYLDYVQAISSSSDRLMHLLDNLIDISRVDANDYEVFLRESNVNKSLQDVYQLFITKAQEKHLKFNFVPTEVPNSQFDNSILERILSLIIDNAIKYTEAGYINISSVYKFKDHKILIRIKDTGVGIDESFQTEIFAPFRQESFGYSKSHQGAGLGLPLAHKLTKLINGEIKVKSKKMEGTLVSIYIPYLPPISKKEREKISDIEKVSKPNVNRFVTDIHPRIFIVEDDKMNRLVFKKMLNSVAELIICSDGDEALQKIESEFNNKRKIDIILMDINLPTPWDGIQLMKEMKNKFIQAQRIPFVAQTAYAMSGDKKKMLEEGFDDYISKPIDKSELFQIIEQNIQNETL